MLMWLTLKLAYLLCDKHTLHNKLSQWCKSNYKSNCKTNLTTYQILRLLAKNYDGVKQKLNPQVNLTLLKKNSLTKKPTKKKKTYSLSLMIVQSPFSVKHQWFSHLTVPGILITIFMDTLISIQLNGDKLESLYIHQS